MKIEVFHLPVPFPREERQDTLVEKLLLDLLDRILKTLDRSFHGRDDIPGEHFRKVVKQGGKIVVVEPLLAARDSRIFRRSISKRGQSAIEFVILMSFALLFMGFLTVIIQNNIVSSEADRRDR